MNRPNLLIFVPDEWRGDVMGHLGNPAAQTPTLDSLVASGQAVSFSRAFCQNPVCTPSRCSFMSGWYPHVRGHRMQRHMLRPAEGDPNLLALLKAAGYHVWWGGKNDLIPAQHGYEPYCATKFKATETDLVRWGHRRATPDLSWRGPEDRDNYYSFMAGRLDTQGDTIFCDGDWQAVLGAVDFVRAEAASRAPFCVYLPLLFPHVPYGVEEPWFSLIARDRLPPRIPAVDGNKGRSCVYSGLYDRQGLQGWSEERWSELRATYYGMCARVDAQLAVVLDALRSAGLYDDTAVFFFSDHGDFAGDYGLVHKCESAFQDCLTRVPFVIKPQADMELRAGVRDCLVELVDFAATVFDVTGIEPLHDHFGISLRDVIAGGNEHRRFVHCEGGRRMGETKGFEKDIYTELRQKGPYWPNAAIKTSDEQPWYGKGAMIRNARWKYIRHLYEKDELYDLHTDPREMENRVDDPGCRGVLLELQDELLRWYQETCDVVPPDEDAR